MKIVCLCSVIRTLRADVGFADDVFAAIKMFAAAHIVPASPVDCIAGEVIP